MAEPARTLVLVDGGLAALVACALSPGHRTVALLSGMAERTRRDGVLSQAARRAVHRQRELLELGELIDEPRSDIGTDSNRDGEGTVLAAGPAQTRALMHAAEAALLRGCERVVWPVLAGDSTDAIADACERALLVTRLVSMDAPAFRIETPFVDLLPDQLAELAFDIDAPVEAAWWCEGTGTAMCGQCLGCVRWSEPLQRWRLAPGAAVQPSLG